MAEIVNRVEIPSSRTGELCTLTSYDDGRVSCTCRFGINRGPMGPADRTCRHVREYRASAGRTLMLRKNWPIAADYDELLQPFRDMREIDPGLAVYLVAAAIALSKTLDRPTPETSIDDYIREVQWNLQQSDPVDPLVPTIEPSSDRYAEAFHNLLAYLGELRYSA